MKMGDCEDLLDEEKWFSALDASLGFWQVPVFRFYRNEIIFTYPSGTHRLRCMPFGLANASTLAYAGHTFHWIQLAHLYFRF